MQYKGGGGNDHTQYAEGQYAVRQKYMLFHKTGLQITLKHKTMNNRIRSMTHITLKVK